MDTEKSIDAEIKEKEKEDIGKEIWRDIISGLLSLVCLLIVSYAIYNTFELFSFLFALYFAYSCITINPSLIDLLVKTPMLTYYSIFLTITLLFSVDDFKNNRDLLALLVTNILICLAVFFTHSKYIVYIFVFINSYVVLRIIMYFFADEDNLIIPQSLSIKKNS